MAPESILDKVRKLLRLAGNNPNPEEAASAAAAAQRLLDAHNLSAAMLELETEAPPKPEEPIEDYGSGAALGVVSDHAAQRLASTIARANGCRIYLMGGMRQGQRVCLVGRPTDAEAVRYLFAWVSSEMARLAEAHGRGKGRVWRNNFKLGIVDTIGRKLREGREAMAAEAKATAAHNPHALMVVSSALAQLEQRGGSVELWVKKHLKLRMGRSSGARYDGSAREAGRKAGESIALRGGRPLTSAAPRLSR
jgi:Protein of unknown function (DUF2786)